MARIDPLPPSEWTKEMYDAVSAMSPPEPRHPFPPRDGRSKGLNALGTFLHHPALARAFHTFNGHILFATTLSARQRELVILRVAHLRDSTYEWDQHVLLAHDQDIRNDEIAQVAAGPDADGWDPLEAALVRAADELDLALERASSEALASFGSPTVYLEQLVERARHVEVQVLGDGHGGVVVLGDRDCTIQRRHQKLVEFAPAPWLPDATRRQLHSGALSLARAAGVDNLVTVEMLVDADDPERWWFIEANARIQVEHTVTEAITGYDIVKSQILIAQGMPCLLYTSRCV